MNPTRNPEILIKAFLEEGMDELPDRSFDAVRTAIEQTRQWAVVGPWKEPQIMTATRLALIAAAIAVVAVVAIRFLPTTNIGPGPTPSPTPALTPAPTPPPTRTPTPTPTPTVTVAPTVSSSPIEHPSGRLRAGVAYALHPFPAPYDGMTFTFTSPSDKWEGQEFGILKFGDNAGIGVGFLRVSALEADPCKWKDAKGDIAVGPSVGDLVSTLQGVDAYNTSAATDVTVGGYSGKEVVVTMPATLNADPTLQTGCDELVWRLFNADGFNIYAQGPQNLWTLSILDVDGERVVVMKSEFPDTDPTIRQELQTIVDSLVITA